jgi:hypothetical protein
MGFVSDAIFAIAIFAGLTEKDLELVCEGTRRLGLGHEQTFRCDVLLTVEDYHILQVVRKSVDKDGQKPIRMSWIIF